MLFKRNPQLGLRLIILCLLALCLMFMDHRQTYTGYIHKTLSMAMLPIQYIVNFPVAVIDKITLSLASRSKLEKENAKLRAQAILLKARMQKLLALEKENIHLKDLMNAAGKNYHHVLVAELLAVDSNPFAHEAVLDKGSHDGVYVGQPVLDAQGVMGQVIAVTPLTSRILLISDQRSGVPVEDVRSGVRAVAMGTGSATSLAIINVPETSDIKVGDVINSSGMGQRYPVGYPVGVVSQITDEPGALFATILAKPSALLNRSREVLLVWPKHSVPDHVLAKQLMIMNKDAQTGMKQLQQVVAP